VVYKGIGGIWEKNLVNFFWERLALEFPIGGGFLKPFENSQKLLGNILVTQQLVWTPLGTFLGGS